MPETLVRIAAVALAVTFAWAAGAKAVAPHRWVEALRGYPLPTSMLAVVAVAVPVVESIVAALLLSSNPKAGGALTLALLAGFSVVVLQARIRQGDRLPCGCFGSRRTQDYKVMLLRNAVLGLLASIVLLGREDASPLAGLDVGRDELLPAALLGIGIALTAWALWQTRGLFARKEIR